MFKKILIANRGEIAVRIIRACKELGIQSVAVYSDVDKNSLPVKLADESVCIGPASPQKSYLHIPAIIAAAEVTGAEAIHPGYGFLAESAEFSEICEANNIVFIGASPDNIRLMGNKSQAKDTMKKFKVPVVPGSDGLVESEAALKSNAKSIGYPLLIKASAGGGGRGMRVVQNSEELVTAYNTAINEAITGFGDGSVYMEKFVEKPRHVEVQVLADGKNAIYLGERECSIQRRHQKLIEEAPSPILDEKLRKEMGEVSVRAAKKIGYKGAGTIEYLVDNKGNFYFMEMNTRVQVEHPVTEFVTGVDIVKEQIRIAYGIPLALKQSDIKMNGHAMEFRINAEDYQRNFMPCPGRIDLFFPPGGKGVRVDSFVYPGFDVPPYYDSLLGKMIIWGNDRDEVIRRAQRAFDEFIIDGVTTIIPFHQKVLDHPKFLEGDFDTHFVDHYLQELVDG